MESESVRVNFLRTDATAHIVTPSTHTTTKMSDVVLNSGMVGLGDGDAVGETVGGRSR